MCDGLLEECRAIGRWRSLQWLTAILGATRRLARSHQQACGACKRERYPELHV
jgi:hypothetical protein